MLRTVMVMLGGLACLSLASCAAGGGAKKEVKTAPAGINELETAYAKLTDLTHHQRAVRGPIRHERSRAMRQLADVADSMLDQSESWGSEARLAGVGADDRENVQSAVSAFRGSLADLSSAARRPDVQAVRSSYKRAMDSYQQLDALTGQTP